jgi:hypothetical protein
MSRTSYTEAQKQAALELADPVGAAEAGRRLGISSGSIRAWRSQAGRVNPPKGADPTDWAERKAEAAEQAFEAARDALRSVREWLEKSPRQAQSSAVIVGILTDKAQQLEQAAERARASQIRVAEAEAELITEVLCRYLEQLGLSWTPAAKRSLAHLLRKAKAGEPLTPGPDTAQAAAEVRHKIGSDLEVSEPRLPEAPEPRSLPGPGETTESDAGELSVPKRIVRALRRDGEAEVLEPDEVLDPDDREAAIHHDDELWHPVR